MSGALPPPPPPLEPNPLPPAPTIAPVVERRTDEESLRQINAACVTAAIFLVLLRTAMFMTESGPGGSEAYSAGYIVGATVGSVVVPAIVAALIGWGNERRARIAFLVVSLLFILGTLSQMVAPPA